MCIKKQNGDILIYLTKPHVSGIHNTVTHMNMYLKHSNKYINKIDKVYIIYKLLPNCVYDSIDQPLSVSLFCSVFWPPSISHASKYI